VSQEREELRHVAEHDVALWGVDSIPVLVQELEHIAGEVERGERLAPSIMDGSRVGLLVKLADQLEKGERQRLLTLLKP